MQIFDSIFGDVPLKKVKFNAKHEFEFISNFKVLQSTFDKHKIPNTINIEKLVKLKFQDNFEFLQFVKKYWDAHFPGHVYDAVGRRSGVIPAHMSTSLKSSGAPLKVKPSMTTTPNETPIKNQHQASTEFLQLQLQDAQTHLVTMEKERDFYYTKLRQVEILVQQAQEAGLTQISIREIFAVLYAKEDGVVATSGTESGLTSAMASVAPAAAGDLH
ncbi:hypothetical protein HMI55_003693 [Coelomomyces lativittatus]|nr:hypothetical protein HMI55_003693 [Coelomomyces lativittatus]